MLPRINEQIAVIWTKETVLQRVVAMTAVLTLGYRGVIMMSSIQVKKVLKKCKCISFFNRT